MLRYWSTLLKFQEALAVRPRARRAAAAEPGPPNLVEPAAGQDYFKLPFAQAERFLVDRGPLPPLPLDPERSQFLEDWLANQYRRADDDENPLKHLVFFPVVHLPRDELAGVLRFPTDLEWLRDGQTFRAPSFEDRSAARFPEPPTELRLSQPGKDPEQTLPFFVDTGLLRRTLKIDAEDIEAFFARLRKLGEVLPRRMVEELCVLLETPLDATPEPAPEMPSATSAASPEQCLTRLHRAVQARLSAVRSRSRAYPVGLIVGIQRGRATWHVQRDLEEASRRVLENQLDSKSALSSYLTGRAPAQPATPCLGRWPEAPLTLNQKQALEHSLGARLAAVQGPPGTGKTTLILNAVMHQLVEKFAPLIDDKPPNEDVLLVTSTNNRAVDNVMAPLCGGAFAENPLALRVGSRDVMLRVTAPSLEQLRDWLSRQTTPSAAEWTDAKRRFAERYRSVSSALSPLREVHAGQHELVALKRHRSSLLEDPDAPQEAGSAPPSVETALQALTVDPASALEPRAAFRQRPEAAREELRRSVQALAKLSRSCEVHEPETLGEVERGYRRFAKKQLLRLNQAFGVAFALPLPPSPAANAALEAWETSFELALSRLLDLEGALSLFARRASGEAELLDVETRIDELTRALGRSGNDSGALERLERELEVSLADDFRELMLATVALRTCWMRQQRLELGESLRVAVSQCQRTRSLRGLFQAQRGAGSWLKRIYPSFGCTLLSIGNAFPAKPDSLRRVIVDEAGQCHAAYAVSALLRARSALVIGDVHQLEPVIGLGVDDERRIRKGMKLKLSEAALEPYRVYDESGNSAQSLADRAVLERPTLRDHFRCQPEIVALCEAWCDYGMIPRAPRASLGNLMPELSSPVLFLPVAGEQQRFAGSWHNPLELAELLVWVKRLLAHGVLAREIGVISPYRGQFESIFRAFRSHGLPVERASEDTEDDAGGLFDNDGGLAVGTVHRFQGGERRVVLLSTTVTRTTSLGFLDDRVHLLNVAASRAKEHLIVVGHEPTLRAGRHTRLLVKDQPRLIARGLTREGS